jgi:hypothetical protein
MAKRDDACFRFAMHFLRDLSGDPNSIEDNILDSKAQLWEVEETATEAQRVDAIVAAAAEFYWDRAAAAFQEYSKLNAKEQAAFVQARTKLSKRDPLQLSDEELKIYMADKDMEKPISSIQNTFTRVRVRLAADGMTWWKSFIDSSGTQEKRDEQQRNIDDDNALGSVDIDLQPLTEWALHVLQKEDSTVGELAVAVGHTFGRRKTEISDDDHTVSKHTNLELKISHLLKKRYKYDMPLDDKSFTVLCLVPADDVLRGLNRLRELTKDMKESAYYRETYGAVNYLQVLDPIRKAWPFKHPFVLHNLRSTYIAHLQKMLSDQSLWPEGKAVAQCIKKYLGHGCLNSSQHYQRVCHVPDVPQEVDAGTKENDQHDVVAVANESDENEQYDQLEMDMAELQLLLAQKKIELLKKKRKRAD